MRSSHVALATFSLAAAVFLAGCSSASTPAAPTPPSTAGAATTVSIPPGAATLTLTAYNPNPVNVAVGTTVRWTNTDSVAHTSTSDTGVWNSATLAGGAHFDFTFQAAGSFPYRCTIHPGMVGTIVVR